MKYIPLANLKNTTGIVTFCKDAKEIVVVNRICEKENKYRPQDNPTGDTHFIVFASKIISSNFLAAILKEVPVRFTRQMLLVGIVSSRCKMCTELASFTFSKNFIGTKPMPRSCITKGIIWSAVAASTLGEKTTPFCLKNFE